MTEMARAQSLWEREHAEEADPDPKGQADH